MSALAFVLYTLRRWVLWLLIAALLGLVTYKVAYSLQWFSDSQGEWVRIYNPETGGTTSERGNVPPVEEMVRNANNIGYVSAAVVLLFLSLGLYSHNLQQGNNLLSDWQNRGDESTQFNIKRWF